MNERDLVHHGLAIKRHALPAAVASLIEMPEADVCRVLAASCASGRAIQVGSSYTLTPLARVALEARYSLYFQGLRDDPRFVAELEAFETINRGLKQVITDWQTMSVGGRSLPNDHSDRVYDEAVIARLGAVHEQLEPILTRLSRSVPRLRVYLGKLQAALEAAEDGSPEWVSDIRRESYHTVWFELHEDLLRIAGRMREE